MRKLLSKFIKPSVLVASTKDVDGSFESIKIQSTKFTIKT